MLGLNNTLLKLFSTLIIIVVICILIGNYAFKNGLLTCEHYIFNTYLYIVLAILIMFMVVLVNDQTGVFTSLYNMLGTNDIANFIFFILILIVLVGLVYLLKTTNPRDLFKTHIIWFFLIFILGFLLVPAVMLGRLENVIGMAGVLTLAIVIITGVLGYYLGDKIITFNWDMYLGWALLALIAVSIIGPFLIKDANTLLTFIYAISIASLIIFILLLLSNHKKMKENADKCIDTTNPPNYPLESFNVVIKIVNVFQDLIQILAIRKMRRRR